MRRIASLKGKIFELVELSAEQAAAIAIVNGYDNLDRFIDRHANWQSTIKDNLLLHDSTPILSPRHAAKPAMQKITTHQRGRPPKPKKPEEEAREKKNASSAGPKKRRKRKSKYGFEKIRAPGACIFVQEETYRVAAAAAYFGGRYNPPRKYSVHKANLNGKDGSRVEWVA